MTSSHGMEHSTVEAEKNKLPLYLLAELLGEEAENVDVEVQLESDGKLARY